MRPVTDPSGLLERIPELEALTDHPGVRRAIERGDPFALYRALQLGVWLGRFWGEAAATARALVSQRRLFLKPLRGAPALFTLNGCGTTVYGDDERGDDGAYIKTYFLVLVFVPIFPLGAYLVADAGGRGWTFFGRAPLGPLTWAWSRLVVLGVVAVVLGGISSALYASRYATIRVANGTGEPLAIRIGDTLRELPADPEVVTTVAVSRGTLPVEVRAVGGRVVEQGSLEANGGGVLVWNVLGAAPVFTLDVFYRATPRGDDPPPHVHCGESALVLTGIDYAFTEPPASLQVSERAGFEVRRQLGVAPGGSMTCLGWLLENRRAPDAIALARRLAEASGYRADRADAAMSLAVASGDHGAALEVARAWRDARPDDLDAHRRYQDTMALGGHRAEVRAEYEARLAASPGSLDAEYLVLRQLPDAEAASRAEALAAAHPDYAPALRILAHARLQALAFAEARATFERLVALEPERAPEVLEMRVQALLGTGDREAARALVRDAFDRTDPADARHIAILDARLGGADPMELFRRLPADRQDPASEAWFRLASRLPVTDAAMEAIDPSFVQAARVLREATHDPAAGLFALRAVVRGPGSSLEPQVWALLFAEACRRGVADRDALAQHGSPALARAIEVFVAQGTEEPELEECSLAERAAIDLVRSRVAGISDQERAARLESVRRRDLFGDGAVAALQQWPPP